jgi:hypothetical protein
MIFLGFTLLLAAGISLAAPKQQTFVGSISDDMCGLKHMMPGQSDKDCTLECVKAGSKFVLADTAKNKVYQLSDQEKPKAFAGEKVKVTGTLQGDTIQVTSIVAAK